MKRQWLWPVIALSGFVWGILALQSDPVTIDLGQAIADQGSHHIATITTPHEPYNSSPPTSGPHVEQKATPGIYTDPVPDEILVHNLEDGDVIVFYQPGKVTRDEIYALETIVKKYTEHVIVAPYPTMTHKIAIVAWTRLLSLERVDESLVDTFIARYAGIDHHAQ